MYIVLGKSGYIGRAFVAELARRGLSFVELSRSDVDYTNFEAFSDYLDRFIDYLNGLGQSKLAKNLTLINCAGYVGKPNVDACEDNKGETILGNVVFPATLSNLCKTRELRLCHISSGCIYNGYKKDFGEEDDPNFTFDIGSFYSGSKALAEKILKTNPLLYIFRLRIPFDHHPSPRNYITKLLSYDKLLNCRNSFSHRGDFVKYALNLLESKAPYGIYNITNKGHASTSEVVDLLKYHLRDKLRLALADKQFSFFSNLEEFSQITTARRSNCILDISKLEQHMEVRTVREAFKDSLSNYTIS